MVNAQNATAAAAITPTYITTTTQPQRSKCSPVCDPTCPLNTPHTPHNTSPPKKQMKTIELKTEVKTPEPELISCKKESDDEVSSLDSPINFKEECLDDFGDWEHGLTIDEYLQMNGNFMD
uniref:Uncharacterized protein n=1 Tax=Megaselia scalaris TaxID=36166 RepID=T1GTX9_MEGSC